jgi:hypothetical protein
VRISDSKNQITSNISHLQHPEQFKKATRIPLAASRIIQAKLPT